jgi:hypothetical protein
MWNRKRERKPSPALKDRLQVLITVDRTTSREVLSAAVRTWLDDGFTTMGGECRRQLLARAVPPGRMPGTERFRGKKGDAWARCFVEVEEEGTDEAYSDDVWRWFLHAASALPDVAAATLSWLKPTPPDEHLFEDPQLNLAFHRSRPPGSEWSHFHLVGLTRQLTADAERESAMLALTRKIAELCGPAYGEISYAHGGIGGLQTSLEAGLYRWPEDTIPQSRRTLRGYSWLTVIPQEIGDRLGGETALRDSGAFAEVAQLANGGYWLLATERFADYDVDAATRVFHALTPALPAGRPEPDSYYHPPRLLALLDAHADLRTEQPIPTEPLPEEPAPRLEVEPYTEDLGDNWAAHCTAIILRARELIARFPDALVQGDTLLEYGADIVYWQAQPGTVWVWQLAHDTDEAADTAVPADVLDLVARDPLSAGLEVIAGPSFRELGLSEAHNGTNGFAPDQRVTVYDGPAPGRQVYQTTYQDMDEPAVEADRMAVWAAAEVVAVKVHEVAEHRRAAAGRPSVAAAVTDQSRPAVR